MKKVISKLLAVGVLACAASVAQAAVVDTWEYVIDMSWDVGQTNFTKSTDPISKTWKTSTVLSWGSDQAGFDSSSNRYVMDGQYASNPWYARSSLIITKPQGKGTIDTNGNAEVVNMFVHTNNAIYASVSSLTETVMNVSIDLKVDGVTVKTFDDHFQVYFYETPNTGKKDCAWGNCDDDLFAFVVDPSFTDFYKDDFGYYKLFDHAGVTYRVDYFQNKNDSSITIQQLDPAVCSAINKDLTSCLGFQTLEGKQNQIWFGFSITAVPEPETYAMLLAGLGLVGVVVRRRRGMLNH